MDEWGIEIHVPEKRLSYEQLHAALTPNCDLNRYADEHGLPLPAWTITVVADTKETVERYAREVCSNLGITYESSLPLRVKDADA